MAIPWGMCFSAFSASCKVPFYAGVVGAMLNVGRALHKAREANEACKGDEASVELHELHSLHELH